MSSLWKRFLRRYQSGQTPDPDRADRPISTNSMQFALLQGQMAFALTLLNQLDKDGVLDRQVCAAVLTETSNVIRTISEDGEDADACEIVARAYESIAHTHLYRRKR